MILPIINFSSHFVIIIDLTSYKTVLCECKFKTLIIVRNVYNMKIHYSDDCAMPKPHEPFLLVLLLLVRSTFHLGTIDPIRYA